MTTTSESAVSTTGPSATPDPRETVSEAAATAPAETSLLQYLGLAVSAALLLLVLALAVLMIVLPKATGSTPLTVLTSSMEPGLPPGTLIVVRPVGADELAIGDVVTYQIASGQPGVVTHRIVAITSSTAGGRTFTFKGDNNSVADADQVLPIQIQGRLWYSVPGIGWVNNLVNGEGRVWIIPAVAMLLFVYAGVMFVGGIVTTAKRRRAARAARRGALSETPSR